MFATGAAMRAGQHDHPLSYELRLPDAVQAAALRLLDASRAVTNATVAAVWELLDDFVERESKSAYKQATAPMGSPAFQGDRAMALRSRAGRAHLAWAGCAQKAVCPYPAAARAKPDRTSVQLLPQTDRKSVV